MVVVFVLFFTLKPSYRCTKHVIPYIFIQFPEILHQKTFMFLFELIMCAKVDWDELLE